MYAKQRSPGPCAYNIPPTMNPNGKFTVSNLNNSLALKFTPESIKSTERIILIRLEMSLIPGPSSYNTCKAISNNGKSAISTIQSVKLGQFSKIQRQCSLGVVKPNTPGPGAYHIISEFGNYERKEDTGLKRNKSMYKGINYNEIKSRYKLNTSANKKLTIF